MWATFPRGLVWARTSSVGGRSVRPRLPQPAHISRKSAAVRVLVTVLLGPRDRRNVIRKVVGGVRVQLVARESRPRALLPSDFGAGRVAAAETEPGEDGARGRAAQKGPL